MDRSFFQNLNDIRQRAASQDRLALLRHKNLAPLQISQKLDS